MGLGRKGRTNSIRRASFNLEYGKITQEQYNQEMERIDKEFPLEKTDSPNKKKRKKSDAKSDNTYEENENEETEDIREHLYVLPDIEKIAGSSLYSHKKKKLYGSD